MTKLLKLIYHPLDHHLNLFYYPSYVFTHMLPQKLNFIYYSSTIHHDHIVIYYWSVYNITKREWNANMIRAKVRAKKKISMRTKHISNASTFSMLSRIFFTFAALYSCALDISLDLYKWSEYVRTFVHFSSCNDLELLPESSQKKVSSSSLFLL